LRRALCLLLGSLALGGPTLGDGLTFSNPTTLGRTPAPTTARFPLSRRTLGSFLSSDSGVFRLDPAAVLLRALLKELLLPLSPPLRGGLICWRKDKLTSNVPRRDPLERGIFLIREWARVAYLRKRRGRRRWCL
jgi:hypothetical protein